MHQFLEIIQCSPMYMFDICISSAEGYAFMGERRKLHFIIMFGSLRITIEIIYETGWLFYLFPRSAWSLMIRSSSSSPKLPRLRSGLR